jgi:hypothetical protein
MIIINLLEKQMKWEIQGNATTRTYYSGSRSIQLNLLDFSGKLSIKVSMRDEVYINAWRSDCMYDYRTYNYGDDSEDSRTGRVFIVEFASSKPDLTLSQFIASDRSLGEIADDMYQFAKIVTLGSLKKLPVDDAIKAALAAPTSAVYNLSKDLLCYYLDKRQNQEGIATLDQLIALAQSIPTNNSYYKEANKICLQLLIEKSLLKPKQSEGSLQFPDLEEENVSSEDRFNQSKEKFLVSQNAGLQEEADRYFAGMSGDSITEDPVKDVKPNLETLFKLAEKLSLLQDIIQQKDAIIAAQNKTIKSIISPQAPEIKGEPISPRQALRIFDTVAPQLNQQHASNQSMSSSTL